MSPTPQLRFVERTLPMHPFYKTIDAQGNTTQAVQTIHVLQQFWIPSDEPYEEWLKVKDGEWRDVPLEKE